MNISDINYTKGIETTLFFLLLSCGVDQIDFDSHTPLCGSAEVCFIGLLPENKQTDQKTNLILYFGKVALKQLKIMLLECVKNLISMLSTLYLNSTFSNFEKLEKYGKSNEYNN
ncbi:hypothetical protein [Flavobacterium aurantiibacter]|uniref:Uncharacterized protein n=1 Tax=Flavobacterium aurantiibacter TaxID=2023067 RepID=A0A255ZYZ4_9FLAO|nr:hypothetical protein [Flavobacterium aurantiibacter]OYQ46104.1 hypothetical protein CHX27_04945 [Flavobacterium aurantiibacter]